MIKLPVLDTPIYETILPLSKKAIQFRPFKVKEQKVLMMAMEANDKGTIERNVKQILRNCTLTENVDIDSLPIIDIEFYFLQLRARSVGEIVENQYKCENVLSDDTVCNNTMIAAFNLLEVKIDNTDSATEEIKLTDKLVIKMKYPSFSLLSDTKSSESVTDMAFNMIIDSIDYIFDGEQFYYAKEVDREELSDFIDNLNQEQFSKIENFFETLPKLNKKMELTCNKCKFQHKIEVEGLENFFG